MTFHIFIGVILLCFLNLTHGIDSQDVGNIDKAVECWINDDVVHEEITLIEGAKDGDFAAQVALANLWGHQEYRQCEDLLSIWRSIGVESVNAYNNERRDFLFPQSKSFNVDTSQQENLIEYFTSRAMDGDSDIMEDLAMCFDGTIKCLLDPDLDATVEFASFLNDDLRLASHYYNGWDTPVNKSRAWELCQDLFEMKVSDAELKYPFPLEVLMHLFIDGEGGAPRNLSAALHLMRAMDRRSYAQTSYVYGDLVFNDARLLYGSIRLAFGIYRELQGSDDKNHIFQNIIEVWEILSQFAKDNRDLLPSYIVDELNKADEVVNENADSIKIPEELEDLDKIYSVSDEELEAMISGEEEVRKGELKKTDGQNDSEGATGVANDDEQNLQKNKLNLEKVNNMNAKETEANSSSLKNQEVPMKKEVFTFQHFFISVLLDSSLEYLPDRMIEALVDGVENIDFNAIFPISLLDKISKSPENYLHHLVSTPIPDYIKDIAEDLENKKSEKDEEEKEETKNKKKNEKTIVSLLVDDIFKQNHEMPNIKGAKNVLFGIQKKDMKAGLLLSYFQDNCHLNVDNLKKMFVAKNPLCLGEVTARDFFNEGNYREALDELLPMVLMECPMAARNAAIVLEAVHARHLDRLVKGREHLLAKLLANSVVLNKDAVSSEDLSEMLPSLAYHLYPDSENAQKLAATEAASLSRDNANSQRRSAFNIGVAYEFGLGVSQDFHLAKRYLDMAGSDIFKEKLSSSMYYSIWVRRAFLWIHRRLFQHLEWGDANATVTIEPTGCDSYSCSFWMETAEWSIEHFCWILKAISLTDVLVGLCFISCIVLALVKRFGARNGNGRNNNNNNNNNGMSRNNNNNNTTINNNGMNDNISNNADDDNNNNITTTTAAEQPIIEEPINSNNSTTETNDEYSTTTALPIAEAYATNNNIRLVSTTIQPPITGEDTIRSTTNSSSTEHPTCTTEEHVITNNNRDDNIIENIPLPSTNQITTTTTQVTQPITEEEQLDNTIVNDDDSNDDGVGITHNRC